MTITIMIGDVREQLRKIPSDSIHCCVTSPPYWGLRDYGVEGQIGLEATPAEFIAVMVEVFDEVRRVLRPDGTCWINMGDSYNAGTSKPSGASETADVGGWTSRSGDAAGARRINATGLKVKDLCMMPHRLAIALQDAGWWVRQDIVWSKPNPMPESVRDRCTKSHEYIFLLTKSAKYYYDAEAIKEPVVGDPGASRNRFDTKDYDVPGQKPQKRLGRGVGFGHGTDAEQRQRGRVGAAHEMIDAGASARMGRGPGWRERTLTNGKHAGQDPQSAGHRIVESFARARAAGATHYSPFGETRNKRSVWTMATHSFAEAHFATFPPELPRTCILAGCPPGGTVLDPFFGAGTTGLVCDEMQLDCVGIELNRKYAEIARKRIHNASPLLSDIRIAA